MAMTMTAAHTDVRDLWYLGNQMKIRLDGGDTGGQFALIEVVQKPGSEPPMHVHENEDETFIVLEGELKVIVGGEEHVLEAGGVQFAPRGVPHRFEVLTPAAHTLTIITPAGFENFFRILGVPAVENRPDAPWLAPSRERIAEVAAQFGVRVA